MDLTSLTNITMLAQDGGGSAYGAGQVAGMIFMVVLVGAIVMKLFKKK